MKKKLQAELKDLANRILKNDQENSTSFLKQQARELYEKLTVLAFTEENLEAITSAKTHSAPPATSETTRQPLAQGAASGFKKEVVFIPQPPLEIEEKDDYLPDGTEYNEDDSITEPNTEKIKDIVAHMPPETDNMDNLIHDIIARNGVEKKPEPPREQKPDIKSDFRNIGVDYDNLPNFEPVKKSTPPPPRQTPQPQQTRPQQPTPSPQHNASQQQNLAREDKQEKDKPRSLNDRLKKGINIGLNERLAFIRHLFEGKTADYNRVVSQLNTFDSVTEAKKFIELVVKPDYRNWEGKEEYEQRFLDLVENKFRH